jgi:hypothetical protein
MSKSSLDVGSFDAGQAKASLDGMRVSAEQWQTALRQAGTNDVTKIAALIENQAVAATGRRCDRIAA